MSKQRNFDYLVIGAGPAGLQLGYYLQQAKRDYLIVEAGESAGTFFKTYPRHRKLISINKVYTGYDDPEVNLRWDWNSLLSKDYDMLFKTYSKSYFPHADDLVRYLGDFANQHTLNIQYNTKIINISRNEAGFQLIDEKENVYFCRRLIMATGVSTLYLPAVPGIELTENYSTVSVDPQEFTNQRVLIIGKGNSGFETADNLIETTALLHVASPQPLNFAWKSRFVGHLRAVNNNLLDTYQLKSQNAVFDVIIDNIKPQGKQFVVSVSYCHADGEKEDIVYDRVLTCTGFQFNNQVFDEDSQPALAINNRFPAQTSEWESTNIKDLYFAGTLMQARDYKKTTSGFIHGFRYNVRTLHYILEQKYHHNPLPNSSIQPTAEAILQAVIKRINRTSALWQQFGFLCDLLVMPDDGPVYYYEELPVSYIHDGELGRSKHYYLITLEFGKIEGDPFNIQRHPEVSRADSGVFLHPVIRRYSGSTLIAEHHVLENLFSDWRQEVHTQPLLEYFAQGLASRSTEK